MQSATWTHKVAERVVTFAPLWSGTQASREPTRRGRAYRDMAFANQHLLVDSINFVRVAPDSLASWKELSPAGHVGWYRHD